MSESPTGSEVVGAGEPVFEFHVSELAANTAGGMAPFGEDVEFPVPLSSLGYVHPGPESLPHLLPTD